MKMNNVIGKDDVNQTLFKKGRESVRTYILTHQKKKLRVQTLKDKVNYQRLLSGGSGSGTRI